MTAQPAMDSRSTAELVWVDGTRIIWSCETCTREIRPEAGYLRADWSAVAELIAARRDAHRELTAGTASVDTTTALSSRVPWRALHTECDPAVGTPGPLVKVGAVDTTALLIHRTAKMMRKPWVRLTDWSTLIRAVAELASNGAISPDLSTVVDDDAEQNSTPGAV